MKYRSRTEIIGEILQAANGGNATRNKILYKAFLNYDQLKDYLKLLIESDLLRYDGLTHSFKTTEKGLQFLDIYNQISDMIKEEQPQQQQQQQQQMWIQM